MEPDVRLVSAMRAEADALGFDEVLGQTTAPGHPPGQELPVATL